MLLTKSNDVFERMSRWLLLLSIFLIPFYFFRVSFHGIKTNIFEITIFLSCVVFSLSLVIENQRQKKIILNSIWAFLFILTAAFSILLSSDKLAAAGIFKGWFLTPYIMYLLMINIFTKKDIPTIIKSLFLASLFVSIWAALQRFGFKYFFPNQIDTDLQKFLNGPNIRVFSFFESPNYLAMYLAPIIFLSSYLLIYLRSNIAKLLVLVILLLMALVLFWTDSRSGLIAFNMGISFLLIYYLSKRRKVFNYAAIIFVLIFCLSFFLYILNIKHPNSEQARRRIFVYSIEMVKENPILGVGLNGYSRALAQITKNNEEFKVYYLPYVYHPHNVYLAIWLNLGLFGFILFIFIIAKFYFNLFSDFSSKINILLFTAMLTILAQGFFDTNYFKNDLSAIFWLLCALAYVANPIISSKQTK